MSKKCSVSYKNLDGYCGYRNDPFFNAPVRKQSRDLLYNRLVSEIRRSRGCKGYDKFFVVNLVLNKIREGRL